MSISHHTLLFQLREDYLSEMITSQTIDELVINNSSHVTGRFLTNLKKYLITLCLNRCDFLLFKYIKSAENYLTKLKRLELNQNSSEILQNLHFLLDKTPDLEHLSLMGYCKTYLGDKLPAAISRLSRLREVHLWGNENVTDAWAAGLASGCPALRTVNVGFCLSLSPAGLLALCRARPALEELVVAGMELTDADMAACALCCGGLRLLDMTSCSQITRRLPESIAGPRARPLLLRLGFFHIAIKGVTRFNIRVSDQIKAASFILILQFKKFSQQTNEFVRIHTICFCRNFISFSC